MLPAKKRMLTISSEPCPGRRERPLTTLIWRALALNLRLAENPGQILGTPTMMMPLLAKVLGLSEDGYLSTGRQPTVRTSEGTWLTTLVPQWWVSVRRKILLCG